MLKVVHDADASNENGRADGSLLDEIVRDGARAMLAAALQAEWPPTSMPMPTRSTRTGIGWWCATGITTNARC
jgi:hypothetical protein